MPRLTLISSQFIYLRVIVIVLLRQLEDALRLLRDIHPQLRRMWWERWLQVRASEYRRSRTCTSQWRIKRLWGIFSDFVGGESAIERMPG